jgi:threonine dehydratase
LEVSPESIDESSRRLSGVVLKTPIWYSDRLSKEHDAKVYLKREDLQQVRSYKISGAYNLMSSLSESQKARGVMCASSGNHAQGVALSASLLGVKAVIFMPTITPLQKINKVKSFGGNLVEVRLVGQNYDESQKVAE